MTDRRSGFSLIELLVTLTILAMVVAALMVILAGSMQSKTATEGLVEAQQAARATVELIARDIRSAGYGVDKDAAPPQPAFAYVDSMEIILYANLRPDTLQDAYHYRSSTAPSAVKGPLAPDPAGLPLPYPVRAGSVYPAGYVLPAAKWRGGAEMIRYTLDLNDDGVVDAADQDQAIAGEARRSMNPNDFVLARAVYGDSADGIATHNGGALERVGLVRGPGTGVPPMFTVYLGSNPTPWDWAGGPVPASRLGEISRVVVNVTAEARRPARSGTYARSTITTEVNSLRNVPEAGNTTYGVSGYVFDDLDEDGSRDAGEPGLRGVVVRLGTAAIGQTSAAGYYSLRGAPERYVVRQDVPEGYGALTPDSLVVDFIASPTDVAHSFADTAKSGGWIVDTCWVDEDSDQLRDPGEPLQDNVQITVGSVTRSTNGMGATAFWVPPGGHTVSAVAPESMFVVTTNPVVVTIVDGDTVRVDFGVRKGGTGTVSGRVYKDLNRNGVYDTGETGIPGVWVAVTKGGGLDVLGFATTDASGLYTITVPSNDPDHVTPYELTYQVPAGYYAMGSTVIQPIWLDVGEAIADQNFGVQSFQIITLTADRVLSLASGELMEKDWGGNDNAYDTKSHRDQDLVLGSEWVSNPNISVWFNQWDSSPLFTAAPTYLRNAQASALAMAVGQLDPLAAPVRGVNSPDVVTGLQSYIAGNIAVWPTKNTSGNFGFLPDMPAYYKTQDQGDVNAVALARCDANGTMDVIAGTRSYAGAGTIEVWLNNGLGVLTRDEIYPPGGGLLPGTLGEIRSLALADLDADADSDLVATTRTAENDGFVHVFEKLGVVAGARYVERARLDLNGEGNAVVTLDVNGDGRQDICVGTKTNDNSGRLEYWRNDGFWGFTRAREINAPGVVLSLAVGDFGGLATRQDLAVGYRVSVTSYTGGVRIYLLDLGTLPASGTDPSGGAAPYMTPAANVNHFNFGSNPDAAGPRLSDLAVAQKPTATTGQVVIFIR